MNRNQYKEYLVSRLFESNGFASADELMGALREAGRLDENTQWRERKVAFNKIADRAPMRNEPFGYCVAYADVVEFVEQECDLFSIFEQQRRSAHAAAVAANAADKDAA